MFTRRWMAVTAVGFLSLVAVPVVSMAKTVAHPAPVAARVSPIAHKTAVVAKKPVAKRVVKKSHAKTTATKHGKKPLPKHASKHVTKHTAAKHSTAKHTAVKHTAPVKKTATVTHKTAAKPVVVAAPPMF